MKNLRKIFFMALLIGIYLQQSSCNALEYHVVDGDSLEYGTERIRLNGIDAPEYFQSCKDQKGNDYSCGIAAKNHLAELVANGISCTEQGTDKYGRSLQECFLSDGTDINKEMVASGWAVAYGDKYKKEETQAKQARKGIWKGKFMRPELYRALNGNKQKNKKR
ncbi:MAG: thermonuclease family protein [Alphaproteobacteria bacterium]|nr:thermonuclease family protein [Alphaproteobacteria bacterium]